MRHIRAAALLFLIGNCVLHALPGLPDVGWLSLGPLLISSGLKDRRLYWLAVPAVAFAWTWWHASLRLGDQLDPAQEGRDLTLVGTIDGVPERKKGLTRFLFQPSNPPDGLPRRIRLSWYRPTTVPAAGERWQLEVRLRRPRGFANPGGFDYRRHLLMRGVGAVGYVRESSKNRRQASDDGRFSLPVLRSTVSERLADAIRDSPSLGIISGLAVGMRERITPRQWEVFQLTGSGHLMAISGLHIGLIAALLFWSAKRVGSFLPRLLRRRAPIDVGLAFAFLGALCYAMLAGFALPTRRALLMLSVLLVTLWQRRQLSVGNGLSLALLVVLVDDPMASLSAGFWLSFAAVAAIAVATTGLIGADGRLWRMWRVQWIVFTGLVPVSLASFGQISLVAPLVNLVLIPLFGGIIVPAVLFAVLMLFSVPAVGTGLLGLVATVIDWIWPGLEAVAYGFSSVWQVSPPLAAIVAAGLGVVMLIGLPGVPGRWAGLLLLLPVLLWRSAPVPVGGVEIAVLDVGQGLAAVVRTRNHVLAYDAGPMFGSGTDAASLVVAPYLSSLGIRRLDLLVISHSDTDHSGGAMTLIRRFRPKRVMVGPTVEHQRLGAVPCHAGQSWQWDGVRFEMLHPPKRGQWTGNNSSCVLRISSSGGSMLLPGDIEKAAEFGLLSTNVNMRARLVVVPHHGSATSSTPQLVRAVGAELALVSVGYRNRWNLPKREVADRWRAQGAQLATTAHSGALIARLYADGRMELEGYRNTRRSYWWTAR